MKIIEPITVPVTAFTTLETVIHNINEAVADRDLTIRHISYNKYSLMKGEIEILATPNNIERYERPSKFKVDATSQFYCVFKKNGKWHYKFVRKNEKYLGGGYDTEIEAALAYDRHVFAVDGHALKTNFPERLV